MAEITHLTVFKGSAVVLRFTMDPVEDISGWTIALTVKRKATDTADVLSKVASVEDGAGGVFTVSLDHDELDLPARVYQYDVQRIDNGSEGVLSIGQFIVAQEVLY